MQSHTTLHTIKSTRFQHQTRAAQTVFVSGFFGWLKYNPNATFFRWILAQQLRGTECTGGVNIVTTCMHHPLVAGTMCDLIELFDWKRIHVRPDSDCLALANIHDYTSSTDTRLWFQTKTC